MGLMEFGVGAGPTPAKRAGLVDMISASGQSREEGPHALVARSHQALWWKVIAWAMGLGSTITTCADRPIGHTGQRAMPSRRSRPGARSEKWPSISSAWMTGWKKSTCLTGVEKGFARAGGAGIAGAVHRDQIGK